jgi:hypothetical protein
VTDDKIKKYFLGELSGLETERIEEDCAQNAELTQQVKIVENEIIDDYLRKELSESDRKLFETNYLTTKARHEKVEFSNEFFNEISKRKLAEEPKQETSNWRNLLNVFRFPRLIFAGVSLLVLAYAGIYFWQTQQIKPEIVQKQDSNQVPTITVENKNTQIIQNVNVVNQNVGINKVNQNQQINVNKKSTTTPSPMVKPTLTPTPKSTEPTKVTLASFTIFPESLRSNGEQSIKISPENTKVNLRLALPKDAENFKSYQAIIKTADGEIVSTFTNLKSLNLTLPAKKFGKKTYVVFLSGSSGEPVAEYTFRVNQ